MVRPTPPPGCLHLEIPPPHNLHPSVVFATLPLEAVAHQGPEPLPVAPGGWGCTRRDPGNVGDGAGVKPHGTPPQ